MIKKIKSSLSQKYADLKENKKGGFTLIELVVVIAIIAILALIIVPNLTAYIAKGDETKIKANMKNIHTAAETVEQTEGLSLNVNSEDEGVILVENKKFTDKLSEYSNNKEVQVGEDFVKEVYTVSRNKASGNITVRFENKVGEEFTFNGSQFTGGSAESEVVEDMGYFNLWTGGQLGGLTRLGAETLGTGEKQTFDIYVYDSNGEYLGSETVTTGKDLVDLSIPGTIGGKKLVYLNNGSLSGWNLLGAIKLPEGLERIDAGTFYNSMLTTAVIPRSLKDIGPAAFQNSNIEFVTIPGSIKVIEANLFSGTYNLNNVTLEDGVEEIGTSAFLGSSIKSIKLPSTLRYIRGYAFQNSGIESLAIPEGVETIGDNAFHGSGIKDVSIPGSVTAIPSYAFNETKDLRSVTIEEGVETIGVNAFGGSGLQDIRLPNSLEVISSVAFSRSQLSSIKLGEGVKVIESAAFQETKLTEITIPASVETIQGGAFAGVSTLKKVIIEGDNTDLSNQPFGHNSPTGRGTWLYSELDTGEPIWTKVSQ